MPNYPADGAAFLDEKVPDWAERINLAQLNISSLTDCPLGQLYGDYYKGLQVLGLDQDRDPDRYGFRIHSGVRGWELGRNTMNQQWRAEILKRLDPNKPKPTHESLLTDDEKRILTVLIAEQRANLQTVSASAAGQILKDLFKEQALLLEQIELKLELAND